MPYTVTDVQTRVVYVLEEELPLRAGRAAAEGWQADIPCVDPHVSRVHCELHASPWGVRVVDRSTFGSFVAGKRVEGEAFAQRGDRIVLGHNYTLEVLDDLESKTMTAVDATAVDLGLETRFRDTAEGSPPAVIAGRYTIKGQVGRGGMGAVFEAFDEHLGRRCAVKVLRSIHSENQRTIERFRQEALIGAQLGRHDGIVDTYEVGSIPDTGELYMVMDFVDGGSLQEILRVKPLEPQKAARVVSQLAWTVAYAHQRGFIHRDIKPGNILLARDGRPLLTDFGLARALDSAFRLTETGQAIGSPYFMSPEQIRDSKRADRPADVWALGAVLYACLTGRPPFQADSVRVLLRSTLHEPVIPPHEHRLDMDVMLSAVCVRALRKDPEDRPTAAELASDLQPFGE